MVFSGINRTVLHDNIFKYALIALAFVIPIHDRLATLPIIVMVINFLVEGRYGARMAKLRTSLDSRLVLAFGALYVTYLLGLLYSRNLDYGRLDLEIKLSLFIFPLLFSGYLGAGFRKPDIINVFRAFFLGCMLSCLILLGLSWMNYTSTHLVKEFYYDRLSHLLHPSYLSMFLNFALAIIAHSLIERWDEIKQYARFGLMLLSLFFFVFIILLSSKAGILTLCFSSVTVIGYLMIYKKRWLAGIFLIIALSFTFTASLKLFSFSVNRINIATEAVKKRHNINKSSSESSAERLMIWNSSGEVIRRTILTGVGTGDVKDELMREYRAKGYRVPYEKKLNAHNQYLQTTVALGILGFWLLLLSFLLPGINSMKNRNILYFLFLMIVGFNFLFESMLERQSGVVFYAFFNAFLFYVRKELRPKDTALVK